MRRRHWPLAATCATCSAAELPPQPQPQPQPGTQWPVSGARIGWTRRRAESAHSERSHNLTIFRSDARSAFTFNSAESSTSASSQASLVPLCCCSQAAQGPAGRAQLLRCNRSRPLPGPCAILQADRARAVQPATWPPLELALELGTADAN